jgi:uncharacterized protein (TIGR00645 family)
MPQDIAGRVENTGSRIEAGIESLLFAARWTLVPLYLGMGVALLVLAYKFFQKLIIALLHVPDSSLSELIVATLSLVDLSLVANLIVMVMLAGYANFVAPFRERRNSYRPPWLDHVDFTALKLKLVSAVTVIAAVSMLETFMEDNLAREQVILHLAMLLGFGAVAVLLALMDRIASGPSQGA